MQCYSHTSQNGKEMFFIVFTEEKGFLVHGLLFYFTISRVISFLFSLQERKKKKVEGNIFTRETSQI